jgi:hypothetical protein
VRDGDVSDTLELMQRVVWTYRNDTQRLAPLLKRSSLEDTCRAIWEFIYKHIQYRLDKKGLEQLRRPARTWQERRQGVDCDCMSIFTSSILLHLGIPHAFRVTRYSLPHWQHVYVIVPRSDGGYFTIDGVLSRFDYEKPYTDKMDVDMDMKGIDVAVLSGPGNLPGEIDNNTFAYHNLVNTRRALREEPTLVASLPDAAEFIQMLDYAIRYYHTDRRDAALALLARNEDFLNAQNGVYQVNGYPLDTADEVLGAVGARNYFRCIQQAACKPCKQSAPSADVRTPSPVLHIATAALVYPANQQVLPVQTPQRGCPATSIIPETTASADIPSSALHTQPIMAQSTPAPKGLKKVVQSAAKAVIKFNPVSIAARNGYLLALKLNIGGMSSKLKWAYASQAQAAAKGIPASLWQKSRTALARVVQLFADRLQGSRDALSNAILKGKAGGLGNPELGEAATAAALTAAAPLIIATLNILKEAGLIGQNVNLDITELEAQAQQALEEEAVVMPQTEINTLPAMEPTTSGAGALAWAKANPLPAIAIAAGIGYLAYNALARPKSKRANGKTLSGLPKPKRRKAGVRKKTVRAVLIR